MAEVAIDTRATADKQETADKQQTIVVAALTDPEPFVRKCAATSIRMFPPEAIIPEQGPAVVGLCVALQDSEGTVRRAA